MKFVAALIAYLVLIGLAIFLGQIGDNNETAYLTFVGLLVVSGLVFALGFLAYQGRNAELQKQYFTVIGTLVGLIGGLAGGVAIGNSAGESAAEDVGSSVEENVESVGTQVDEVKTGVDDIKGGNTGTATTPDG